MYEKKFLDKDIKEIAFSEGCEKCNHGYLGRIAIQEVLLIDETIRDAINDSMPKEELRKLVYENGKVATLFQDGLMKVEKGLTSLEEIMRLIEVDDVQMDEIITSENHEEEKPEKVQEEKEPEEVLVDDFTLNDVKPDEIEEPTSFEFEKLEF